MTSGSVALKYNAFGQRAVETITGGGTHFLFAEDGMLLAEHTTAGALVRNYVYLNGQPIAIVDAAGTISYILNDQVGQPQKMLNASGAVSWHRVAGIFGDTVSQPIGSTATNPQRFPGQQFDPNLALHYNYFRDYDPATGRYIETDPIGLAGGINLYTYVGGNPVNYVDLLGLTKITFDRTSGKLTIDPEQKGREPWAIRATSGRPGCECTEKDKNEGPIPRGKYEINTQNISNPNSIMDIARNLRGDWGDWRVKLEPSKGTKTYGRSGFFLHGGALKGSAGCIDIGGGLSGDYRTDLLLKDLRSDPDHKVMVIVK